MSHNIDPIRNGIEQDLPEAFRWLQELVAIHSCTDNAPGVDAAAERVEQMFKYDPDFKPCYRRAKDGEKEYGKHLVLTRQGSSGKCIALFSHNDTVHSVEDCVRNDFSWQRREYGDCGEVVIAPGVLDNKGSTVVQWLTMRALRQHFPEVYAAVTWKLFFNAGEEIGLPDFPLFWAEHLDLKNTIAALVFEGEPRADRTVTGTRRLTTSRKGMATFRLEVDGVPAHAGGSHDRGANAIHQLARLVERVSALTNYANGLTVNVGLIAGGSARNTVASHAFALGEARANEPAVLEWALDRIKELSGPGDIHTYLDLKRACQVRVVIESITPPWKPSAATMRLFEVWREAGRLINYPLEPFASGGLSDANALSAALDVIDGLGPYGEFMHCSVQVAGETRITREYAVCSSFAPKALLNALAINRLAESHLGMAVEANGSPSQTPKWTERPNDR